MERPTIECLRCGYLRAYSPGLLRCDDAGDCPRCQYVGWAYSDELSERTRKLFRDLPVERRLNFRTV